MAGAGAILIVEDHSMLREALAELLRMDGYRTVEAANGEEALAILRSSARSDLILLDLMMPVMDGWKFLDMQRKDSILAAIPVVVMSAVPAFTPPEGASIVGTVQKPYELSSLMPFVERYCDKP